MVDYKKSNTNENLEIIALAFEFAKTKKIANKSIEGLAKRIGVEYRILLTNFGTDNKEKVQEKLSALNHILSYPTTIFIDKKGEVRRIYTGFNGQATGEKCCV